MEVPRGDPRGTSTITYLYSWVKRSYVRVNSLRRTTQRPRSGLESKFFGLYVRHFLRNLGSLWLLKKRSAIAATTVAEMDLSCFLILANLQKCHVIFPTQIAPLTALVAQNSCTPFRCSLDLLNRQTEINSRRRVALTSFTTDPHFSSNNDSL